MYIEHVTDKYVVNNNECVTHSVRAFAQIIVVATQRGTHPITLDDS